MFIRESYNAWRVHAPLGAKSSPKLIAAWFALPACTAQVDDELMKRRYRLHETHIVCECLAAAFSKTRYHFPLRRAEVCSYVSLESPHIMVRKGERPLWKRILYLERIAVVHKRHIVLEGYVFLLLGLTLPIWGMVVAVPLGAMVGWQILRSEIRRVRQAPYGGLRIGKQNATARKQGWLKRRRSLSRVSSRRPQHVDMDLTESRLLALPEEIRRQIFLYLVRPAEELTICSLGHQQRLVAVPTYVWQEVEAGAHGTKQSLHKLAR